MWQGSGRANRENSDRTGRVDAQQVVEGGGGINKCCAGGIAVLYWWLSVYLDVMQQGLPVFAEVESPISEINAWICVQELFRFLRHKNIKYFKLNNTQSSCLYRASMAIKTLFYATDKQIYNS